MGGQLLVSSVIVQAVLSVIALGSRTFVWDIPCSQIGPNYSWTSSRVLGLRVGLHGWAGLDLGLVRSDVVVEGVHLLFPSWS